MQQQGSTIGAINEADKKIALLSDSTTNDNNFVARFNDALSANNAITSNNEWEMNERYVNAIKLKIMSGIIDTVGYDTVNTDSLQYLTIPVTSCISIEEKDFLRELAYTCPFIGGNAVYKARPLWASYAPGAIYDDRLLCIMGQNKNLDYSNLNIDSLYEQQIVDQYKVKQMTIENNAIIDSKRKVLEDGDINIYPNPTSQQLTIEYECKTDGEFILYNSLGQEILKTTLTNENKKVSLLTNDLSVGVYSYKCIFAGCESKNGKITIIK
ncbi:MAG: T9SS type A sorting domain-containing protein [Bacteroidetes bacterium]|nr:T9SS type A sorting domain-containing protein [Bacteroidota bacterium]